MTVTFLPFHRSPVFFTAYTYCFVRAAFAILLPEPVPLYLPLYLHYLHYTGHLRLPHMPFTTICAFAVGSPFSAPRSRILPARSVTAPAEHLNRLLHAQIHLLPVPYAFRCTDFRWVPFCWPAAVYRVTCVAAVSAGSHCLLLPGGLLVAVAFSALLPGRFPAAGSLLLRLRASSFTNRVLCRWVPPIPPFCLLRIPFYRSTAFACCATRLPLPCVYLPRSAHRAILPL